MVGGRLRHGRHTPLDGFRGPVGEEVMEQLVLAGAQCELEGVVGHGR